jgi:DNA polymerase alpha-associated DNA helicase A
MPRQREKPKRSAPPTFAPVPTLDGEEDDCASGREDSDDETEPSPASKPIEGKAKKQRQLGILRPSKSLEVTLFDRMEKMWGDDIKQMLTVQYR